MGVLWNCEAPEKKVYSAYGMTVYGKVIHISGIFFPEIQLKSV